MGKIKLTVIHNVIVVNHTIYNTPTILLEDFISHICWIVVLWIVKCSVLAFYWRLFSTNGRSVRVVIWVIAAAVMCWGIAVVRSPSVIQWLNCSVETVVADSNKDLDVFNDLPVFPCPCILGP